MIRCAAFDFDGTLVDSNEIKRRAYFEIAREFDPDGEVVREVLDRQRSGDRYHVARALAAELAARAALPGARCVEDLAKSLADAYTVHCERAVSTCDEIPGATDVLARLAARGLPLFVNTATPREAVLPILRRRGLDRFFDGVYGGPSSKLENLREIAERVGASPPELLFVGDGEDDRRVAAAFGCAFVGIAPDAEGRFEHPPERRIPDLLELPRVLDEIAGESP
jgi:phosphoglycolate phosphatase-like HAD superfamily hydrolase